MRILSAIEVKNKIEQNPKIRLINALRPDLFKKGHIPNSLNFSSMDVDSLPFGKDEEIIVYCSDIICTASYYAYLQLEEAGYQNVWRFAGGMREWAESGFPIVSGAEKVI